MSDDRVYAQRKVQYKAKLEKLLHEYKNILILGIDNVGSSQMQKVRIALRGRAVMLMGKNTLIRRVIREQSSKNPKLERLLPYVRGNMGFVFTNDNLTEVRKVILENKVPAAAKSGSFAPMDVFVPPGPTGLDPGQTSFFQVLNIATKIVRGSIEIISQVHLIREGEKVTPSHVSLLAKLNIKPFFYGFKVTDVYEDGFVYSASVLDLTEDDLLAKFFNGVNTIAAIGLKIGWPSLATIPHSFANALKNLIALSVMTDYTFEESKQVKEFLENPDAFVSNEPAKEDAPAEAAKEESEEEESDADMGFSLFD
eukprot:TRINITY_DN63446_c0_g4_i1.p2 TRINITY_DN63446_c0_g4~~TRINITY_DN63446_c0_g4_i1.p2  ORF type:complete len:311 (+),score=195.67 TRINITY_DN63446_c0_g4_i1:176-1108(+)